MSTVRLSTTSYVVLGLIALRGPSTPYDLKRAVGHSVGYFWTFPHAQLYSEPRRLRDAGLLDLDQEDSGRRRMTYSITEQGMAALRAWLAEPANAHFELRDVAEIKLFLTSWRARKTSPASPRTRSASTNAASPSMSGWSTGMATLRMSRPA